MNAPAPTKYSSIAPKIILASILLLMAVVLSRTSVGEVAATGSIKPRELATIDHEDRPSVDVAEVQVVSVRIGLDVNNSLRLGDPEDASYLPGEVNGRCVLAGIDPSDGKYKYLGQQMKYVVEGISSEWGIDEVLFEITRTTSYPGWTGNASDPAVTGPDRDDDFSFAQIGNKRKISTTPQDGRAWADFWCKDSGAMGNVRVSLMRNGKVVYTTEP